MKPKAGLLLRLVCVTIKYFRAFQSDFFKFEHGEYNSVDTFREL